MLLRQWCAMLRGDRALAVEQALRARDLVALEGAVFRQVGPIAEQAFHQHLQAVADRVDGVAARLDVDVDADGPVDVPACSASGAAAADGRGDDDEGDDEWGLPPVVERGERDPRACPRCGSLARWHRRRERAFATLFGPCRVRRAEFSCPKCGHLFAPADAAFGLRPGARLSARLEQVCERAGRECGSYQEARELLKEFLLDAVVPSASAMGEVIVRRGRDAAREQQALVERVRRAPAHAPLVPNAAGARDTMVIEVDGGMAPLRDGWREAKCGAVYLTRDRIEKPPRAGAPDVPGRGRVLRSWTVAQIGHWECLAPVLHTVAVCAGLRQAGRIVLIGDGADWIDRFAQAYLPGAIRILDFWHALEHVCAPARSAFGGDILSFERWRTAQSRALKAGQLDAVLNAMRRLATRTPAAQRSNVRDLVQSNIAYLNKRRAQMNYPAFRAQGLPIGSGLIEGRIKHFVKRRLCGPGCHWSEDGANAILQLKAKATNTKHHLPQAA